MGKRLVILKVHMMLLIPTHYSQNLDVVVELEIQSHARQNKVELQKKLKKDFSQMSSDNSTPLTRMRLVCTFSYACQELKPDPSLE